VKKRLPAVAEWVLRLGIGGLFILAGALKASAPDALYASLLSYQTLPEPAAFILSRFLPFLEIVAGTGLISGFAYRGALILLVLMTTSFTAFLASAVHRGLDITCGCFGANDSATLPHAIARNCLLLASLGWLIWRESRRGKRPPPTPVL